MDVRALSARLSLVVSITLLLGACAPAAPAAKPTEAPKPAEAAKPAASPAAAPAAASAPTAAPAVTQAAPAAAGAAGQPKTGGTLRYGMVNDPSTMDPHKFSGAAADVLYGMVYNSLVQYKPDWGGVDGDLAESWDIKDNLSYTFKLRQGVKFHDGSPMTADDVKFSFDRIMDPQTGAYVRPLIAPTLDRIEVVDPQTVRITVKQVNAAFLSALALPSAAIVSKKFVEGGGDLNKTMMGTGPFKFDSRQPNVEIKLVKNPDYFEKGKPYLDAITVLPLPDDTARSTALRNGSVDFIDFVPWKDISAIASNPGFKVYSDTESSGLFMFMKMTVPPLDKPEVRQALNYAVDREAVVKATFFGRGALMNDIFMPKTHWAYVKDLPGGYSYDPAKAKSLLAQAGYPNGFKINMLSTHEVAMHKSGAEIVQANLRDVGIEANLELIDFATDVKRQSAGEYELLMWGGGPLYGEVDFLSAYFRSGSTFPKNTGYSNPQLDKLLDDARMTLDQNQRKGLYRQAFDIILKDAPWIPLAYREQGEAAASNVKGYERVLGSNWNGRRIAMTWIDK
jgi:peptide/nickel transport system substrate-binding protein